MNVPVLMHKQGARSWIPNTHKSWTMKYRVLGKSGLKVSSVGLGTWQWGGEWGKTFSHAEVNRMVGAARDAGINLADTAECYGNHLAERLLGRAISRDRQQWIIATKFGHVYRGPHKRERRYEPQAVVSQLEGSLRALRTDYIDVYQFLSGPDEVFNTPGLWEAIRHQVELGKVRYLGISVRDLAHAAQIGTAAALGVSVIQLKFNLLDRSMEPSIEECRRQGLGVLIREPLAGGWLGGRYQPGVIFQEGDVRSLQSSETRDAQLREVERTQTRTFNYGNPPGAQLLSATNPENGTVTYAYNSDKTLATKTDAKNQQVQYSYDSYKRVTQMRRGSLSGGTFTEDNCQQENYSYDANPYDGSFSQYTLGRLAAVQYFGGYSGGSGGSCTTTFTEMYSYSLPGAVIKKRMQVTVPAQNYFLVTNISMNLDATFTYDNEGRLTATQYPSSWGGYSWFAGPNLGNTFDSMGRPQKLTDLTASSDIITNATYNPAGQLLTMSGNNSVGVTETRTYNSIGQLTNLTSCPSWYGCTPSVNIQYNYPATGNNGKISSQYDALSGETVAYTYDSLNRLATAAGSGWGQSYNYDGFGNLTDQNVTAGTAPALHVSYDPATNRRAGECADANGNINAVSFPNCQVGYAYDIENRIAAQWNGATPTASYAYKPGNKRVWKGTNFTYDSQTFRVYPTNEELAFWSITGQKLATYNLIQYQPGGDNTLPQLVASSTQTNYYFGGKMIKNSTGYVGADRLGSIGKYFPYGQERPSATTDDKEKFATYFRDSETGLDYADNRYHQVGMGRFMTPDPAQSGWNWYAYAKGDPVNNSDPSGLGFDDFIYSNCYVTESCPGWLTDWWITPQSVQCVSMGLAPTCVDWGTFNSGIPGSVFTYDLGSATPDNFLGFSSTYDLNYGAPGFGNDPAPGQTSPIDNVPPIVVGHGDCTGRNGPIFTLTGQDGPDCGPPIVDVIFTNCVAACAELNRAIDNLSEQLAYAAAGTLKGSPPDQRHIANIQKAAARVRAAAARVDEHCGKFVGAALLLIAAASVLADAAPFLAVIVVL